MEGAFVLTIQSRTVPMLPHLESTWVTVVRTVIPTLVVTGNPVILFVTATPAEAIVIGILTGVIVGIGVTVTVVALPLGATPLILGVARATQGAPLVEAALSVLVITMHSRVRLPPRVNSPAGKRCTPLNARGLVYI